MKQIVRKMQPDNQVSIFLFFRYNIITWCNIRREERKTRHVTKSIPKVEISKDWANYPLHVQTVINLETNKRSPKIHSFVQKFRFSAPHIRMLVLSTQPLLKSMEKRKMFPLLKIKYYWK